MRYFFAPPDRRWTRSRWRANPVWRMWKPVALLLVAASATGACQVSSPDLGPACTVTAPTDCPDPAPRYADVAPIIGAHCASPCHWGAPGGPWPLTDYPHVADWQDVVRDDLLDCSMPPPEADSTMTDAERTAILVWIRCGSLP